MPTRGTGKLLTNLRFHSALALAGIWLAACSSEINIDAEAKTAQTVVDDFWQAISSQDVALLSRVVANDDELIVFGTDAAERWVGSSAFLSAEEQMMQVFDVENLHRRENTFQIHSGGNIAWFSTVFDLEISVEGVQASLNGLRTTGVLEKRDDDWVIVQLHTSLPVAGQQVEY